MAPASPAHDLELLQKFLTTLTVRGEFPVAFGGLVTGDGAPLTSFVGTRGQSLTGLLIEPTEGLGGRALSERRPVSATHYRRAETITHRYDREVFAEDIVSLLAIPVVVDGEVRAIIYGGHRIATRFGDAATGKALQVAQSLAWEYSVHDEVERRVAVIETEGGWLSGGTAEPGAREELRTLYAELREITRSITDPQIVRRLDSLRALVNKGGVAHPLATTVLSPREIDVIAHAALGKRNALIAVQLGLTESTVKSYLSSAMRKLDATSRYQAVINSRRLGLIP
jgi:DNA-binding CsgD family transcriptional regulator